MPTTYPSKAYIDLVRDSVPQVLIVVALAYYNINLCLGWLAMSGFIQHRLLIESIKQNKNG